jgi:hypothetical protein
MNIETKDKHNRTVKLKVQRKPAVQVRSEYDGIVRAIHHNQARAQHLNPDIAQDAQRQLKGLTSKRDALLRSLTPEVQQVLTSQ